MLDRRDHAEDQDDHRERQEVLRHAEARVHEVADVTPHGALVAGRQVALVAAGQRLALPGHSARRASRCAWPPPCGSVGVDRGTRALRLGLAALGRGAALRGLRVAGLLGEVRGHLAGGGPSLPSNGYGTQNPRVRGRARHPGPGGNDPATARVRTCSRQGQNGRCRRCSPRHAYSLGRRGHGPQSSLRRSASVLEQCGNRDRARTVGSVGCAGARVRQKGAREAHERCHEAYGDDLPREGQQGP